MVLLWCDGFEEFAAASGDTQDGIEEKYLSSSNVSAATLRAARIEGLSIRVGSNGLIKTDSVLGGGDEMTIGVGVRRNSGTGLSAIVRIYFNTLSTALWDLLSNTNGDLVLRNQLTNIDTAVGGLPNDGNWHYIYWHFKIHPSTGFMRVYVDGVSVISLINIDTTGVAPEGPATGITRFGLGSGGSTEFEFDDVYVASGDSRQDSVVNTLFPDAAGNHTDFTPDSGNNYQRVDERPFDADTSYVESSTSGHTDTYSFDALASTAINGVQVNAMMRSTSGSANMRCVTRTNGTDYPAGSATSVSTSYRNVRQIHDVNPDTSLPWQSSELNASEFGFKVG